MNAKSRHEDHLKTYQKKLLKHCKSVLLDCEAAIKQALCTLDITSLESIATSTSKHDKKHFVILIHPAKPKSQLKIDCLVLKENYLAIFTEQDRGLVKKIDRVIKIKHCLESEKTLNEIIKDLKSLISSESSKAEILHQHQHKKPLSTFKSLEHNFIGLIEKFLAEASLLILPRPRP